MILVFAEEQELSGVISLSASSWRLVAKGNWPYSVSLGTLCEQFEAEGNQLILASKIKGYAPALGMLACPGLDETQTEEKSSIIIWMPPSSLWMGGIREIGTRK